MKEIYKDFRLQFEVTCREHGHIGDLPCPWPGCGNGISEDSFLLVSPFPGIAKDKELHTRKEWSGIDNKPRYSWFGGAEPIPTISRNFEIQTTPIA